MTILACTYFDGVRSAPHAASVIFSGRTLQVVGAEVAAKADVRRVRISTRVGNAPRWLYLPGGETCCITDNDTIDRLARTSRLERTLHRWESQPALAALALAMVALLVWAVVQYGVPWAAREVAARIPPQAEARLGADTLAGLDKQFMKPSKLSEARQNALRSKFEAMARATPGTPAVALHFRASPVIGPNAFALPGNLMVMTDELVAMAKHDKEVLGVLAHELGHIAHRHPMRGLLESSAVALLIAGITGDVASTVSLAASAPALVLQNKFSRDNETEADVYAISMMKQACINPHYFATMLEKLAAKGDEGFFPTFLSSHPATAERIALARAAQLRPEDAAKEAAADTAADADTLAEGAAAEQAAAAAAARAALGAARAAALGVPTSPAEQQRIMELVRQGDLPALESTLGALQEAYERDTTASVALETALSSFARLPADIRPVLDKWVSTYPTSYAARVARARHTMAQATRARGDRSASETSQDQFARMQALQAAAQDDLGESYVLTAFPYLSHRYAMSIARQQGRTDAVRAHFVAAIQLAPLSIETRLAYLDALEPRWGGSLPAMQRFITQSRAAVTDDRSFARLQARLPQYRALEASQGKNHQVALREIDSAIALHESAGLLCQRAEILGNLQRHADALASLQRGLALYGADEVCLDAATGVVSAAPVATTAEEEADRMRILGHVIAQGHTEAKLAGRNAAAQQQGAGK